MSERACAKSGEVVVNTVCAHNCGGRSFLACRVRAGRLVQVEPAPFPDPDYTGLCVRCAALPQWVYAPDRIPSPMRRAGPRGSGHFEAIGWDEALDAIAGRFQALIDAHGPGAIAFSRTSGSSPLGNYSRLAALLGGGGSANFYGGVDMAVHMGLNSTLGFKGMFGQHTNEWTDRRNAKLVIVWGNNPAETSMTSMKFLLDARDAGTRVVVIDPRYTATAVHAHWWIAPRPGSDLPLALGLLHLLIEEGLYDTDFTRAHSVAPLLVREDTGLYLRAGELPQYGAERGFAAYDGAAGRVVPIDMAADPALEGRFEIDGIRVATAFTLLREMVREFPPARAAELTGLAEADIRDLAHLYAREKPSTIGFGYGVDRYRHGDLLTRAGATLAVLTGNIGKPGAGVGVQSHGTGYREAVLGPGAALPDWARTVSVPNIEVGRRPLPVRALFCQGDWLNQRMPDMNAARAYLESLEFVVTVDHFWQTTAQWSDIVLPAATFLEGNGRVRDAIVTSNSVLLRQPAIAPVGQSRPDSEIERDLARRLGLGAWFEEEPEAIVRRQIEGSSDPALSGITLEALLAAGGGLPLAVPPGPHVQYADLRFPTPTGRAEFYVEAFVPFGEALPVHREDHEALPSHPAATGHPLVLIQTHARQRAHSTFFNVPAFLEIWPEPVLELNPDDAAARGLSTGMLAEAFNARGRVVACVVVNPDYPPGLCNITEGWKQAQFVAGNLQELTNGEINQAQSRVWGHANIPFFDTRVEVRALGQAQP
ncbi:MAG: molybdopterin-dependent oxidoreductase [Gammaproteobacteria bacterium]